MSPLKRGVFVISIDTELAWRANHVQEIPADLTASTQSAAERDAVADLLNLFEHYDTRATWAIVGHLFLDRCARVDGVAHPDMARPVYDWLDRDWYGNDPATDLATDPMWYGPDIVEMIKTATPEQEIASHSFSHLIVGDPGCTDEAFADDLRACRDAAGDTPLRSFVYPRNRIGRIEVLARSGFDSYRGLRPRPFRGHHGVSRTALSIVDKLIHQEGSTVYPERVHGIWNIPATNLFAPVEGPRALPLSWSIGQQNRRLRQAARHRSLFHLWFHPHNLIPDPRRALKALEGILREAARLREAGLIDNMTMGALARHLGPASR
jgi:hypothetical protein